jgi:MFS family permease
VGGIAFQFPVGALSDRMDRRIMIAIVSFGTAGLALLLGVVIGASVLAAQAVAFALGGLLGVAWPLLLSHAYDRFTAADRVSMGGALILVFGAGAILGGPIAAQAIELIGGSGLPLTLAVLGCALGAYALWRIARREPASAPEGFAPAAPGARPGHRRE